MSSERKGSLSTADSTQGSSGQLKVAPLPDKSLVYSNHVYVSPSETRLFSKGSSTINYAMINDSGIYICKTHPDCPPGTIGMGALQRETCKVGMEDMANVAPWFPGKENEAVEIKLQVNIIKEKRRAELNEDQLVEVLRSKFYDQPFTRGQGFALEYQGVGLTFNVLSIVVPASAEDEKSRGQITKFSGHGLLLDNTAIYITPDPTNKYLIWEKSANSAAQTVLLRPDFKFADLGIGGLDQEFGAIFRRSFASRLFPPALIQKLGVKHVKGMLLYGPPGTGKTLIARQIGKMLSGKEPQVVNGPEILNKYVGQSEENIRKLFEPAEKEYKEKGEAADLYIIIFDEIDAICKARGSDKSGTGVHDTVVNQLLTKIDGVDSPNNILVIGMTNRKDMLDPALIRPGRLEVHVEIGLPDERGRLQIFNIHTRKMRENGYMGSDVSLEQLAARTKNYSGAEIESVVKAATSYSLYGKIDVTKDQMPQPKDMKDIKVTQEHFLRALDEVQPAFGVEEDELKTLIRGDMLDWGEPYRKLMHTMRALVRQVSTSTRTSLLSVLLQGPPATGKSAIAAKIGLESAFPFVKLISPDNFVDSSERGKILSIFKTFEDAYRSPFSLIIIDNIERLLEYVPIGPRFSNAVLQALLVLCSKQPPMEGRKLMIIATTANKNILEDMQMQQAFNVLLDVPSLSKPEHVKQVLTLSEVPVESKDLATISSSVPFPIGIKQLLMVCEMARNHENDAGTPPLVTATRFAECLKDAGLLRRRANDYDSPRDMEDDSLSSLT